MRPMLSGIVDTGKREAWSGSGSTVILIESFVEEAFVGHGWLWCCIHGWCNAMIADCPRGSESNTVIASEHRGSESNTSEHRGFTEHQA